MKDRHAKSLDRLLRMVRTWIENESGPVRCKMFAQDLQLTITFKGYKKLILERDFTRGKEQK